MTTEKALSATEGILSKLPPRTLRLIIIALLSILTAIGSACVWGAAVWMTKQDKLAEERNGELKQLNAQVETAIGDGRVRDEKLNYVKEGQSELRNEVKEIKNKVDSIAVEQERLKAMLQHRQ